MFKIDNMSVKNYIINRVYIFFKPLLCCTDFGKKYEKSTCEVCPVEVFSDKIITLLEAQEPLQVIELSSVDMMISKSSQMDILSPEYISLIKNK